MVSTQKNWKGSANDTLCVQPIGHAYDFKVNGTEDKKGSSESFNAHQVCSAAAKNKWPFSSVVLD